MKKVIFVLICVDGENVRLCTISEYSSGYVFCLTNLGLIFISVSGGVFV